MIRVKIYASLRLRHQSLIPTLLGRLHEFCFFIGIYHEPNPRIGFNEINVKITVHMQSMSLQG